MEFSEDMRTVKIESCYECPFLITRSKYVLYIPHGSDETLQLE
ncbi:MAG: hypothetical protein QXG16_04780 [Candidatus Anstonellaceae archaeon]